MSLHFSGLNTFPASTLIIILMCSNAVTGDRPPQILNSIIVSSGKITEKFIFYQQIIVQQPTAARSATSGGTENILWEAGKVIDKIKISSTHNFICQKFTAAVEKIATFCPAPIF